MAKYRRAVQPVVPAPISPQSRLEGKHWVITAEGLKYKDEARKIEFEVSLDDDLKKVEKTYKGVVGKRAFDLLNR